MIIKRARGHRLYSVTGDKILDLSMDFGRAVLGHRPNGLSLSIKNAVDRGLYSRYSNIYIRRLEKDLRNRFPGYEYITVLEYEKKVNDYFGVEIVDPLFNESKGVKVAYWRPFLESPDAQNIVVLYPLPGLNTTTLLLSKANEGVVSDNISPVLLTGILRSLYDYDLELKGFSSKVYDEFKSIPNIEFKPPYITFNYSDDDYKLLVEKALLNGVMLNSRDKIGILPNDFSYGEIKKIIETLG